MEPFFVESTLTGNKYVDLFRGMQPDFLDDHVLLADLTKLWFQHDGVPVHKVAPSRSKLQDIITGYGAVVKWLPELPDLSPQDFFLWSF